MDDGIGGEFSNCRRPYEAPFDTNVFCFAYAAECLLHLSLKATSEFGGVGGGGVFAISCMGLSFWLFGIGMKLDVHIDTHGTGDLQR